MAGEFEAAKAGAEGAKQSADIAWQHFQTAANHLVQDMGDPTKTSPEQYHDAFQGLKDACSEITETSYEKSKTALKAKMLANGWTEEAVEEWLSNQWKEVIEAAENIRKSKAAENMARILHRVKVGFVSALLGLMAIAFAATRYDTWKHGDARAALENDIGRWHAESEFQRQTSEFNALTSALQDPLDSVPTSAESPAAMPAPVAAVAQAPLAVAIPVPVQATAVDPSMGGTQTFETTVGQVWRAMPESHQQIETAAEHAREEAMREQPYQYAFQDPKSCSARHCLDQHLRVDATVKAPWENGPTIHIESH